MMKDLVVMMSDIGPYIYTYGRLRTRNLLVAIVSSDIKLKEQIISNQINTEASQQPDRARPCKYELRRHRDVLAESIYY